MSRMLELVRTSQLSSHQMMSASKGALRVPAAEMVEILVYIAEHNKIFRETARMTLAGWDEATAKQIAADPNTPREVLDYWLSPQNLRPALLPVLLENPSASAVKIGELASTAKNEIADVLIASPRVCNSPQIFRDLSGNHFLSGAQAARVKAMTEGEPSEPAEPAKAEPTEKHETELVVAGSPVGPHAPAEPLPGAATTAETSLDEQDAQPVATLAAATATSQQDDSSETENALVEYLAQHANEITAEGDKPFHAIGGVFDEVAGADEPAQAKAFAAAAAAAGATAPGSTTPAPESSTGTISHTAAPTAAPDAASTNHKPSGQKKPLVNPEDEKRGSVLQKIAALDIKGRIQLAMKGTKEERSILVRDGTKIVALAVLESPKISDGEVEKVASQKNVLEAVLRAIPMKRRFAKNYVVMRNLVANPRTPLDVALGLMKNLLVGDLKNLSGNKEVSDTVRKMALRMFRQKNEAANK